MAETKDPEAIKFQKLLEEAASANARLKLELEAAPAAEARGIAYIDLYKYDDEGRQARVNITARSMVDAATALKSLLDAVALAKEYGLTPYIQQPEGKPAPAAQPETPPAAQPQAAAPQQAARPAAQPQGARPAGFGMEWIHVTSVSHAVTESGVHYLRVKGGKMSKYGARCWEEVAARYEMLANFASWEIGKEYAPPPECQYALVEDGRRVVEFASAI